MIKINLLPFRAAKRKRIIQRQIFIYAAALVVLIGVFFLLYLQLNSKLSRVNREGVKLQAELDRYRKDLKQIDELDKKTKEIQAKLDVIKRLEKAKTGPVHLLDEIAMAIPEDALWLSSFNESKGTLSLQGTAMDNETVARFMTNLEKSEYIKSVDLKSTQQREISKYQLNVSDFVLECKTYAYVEKPPPEPDKKKSRKSKKSKKK